MSSIGERLRAARVQSGLSLDDLAQATKINRHYLEAIEQGSVPNLPQTYYRAFLKSYAQRVGVDPEEILRDHTAEIRAIENTTPDAPVPVASPVPSAPPARENIKPQSAEPHSSRRLFAVLAVLVIGFGVSIFWLRKEAKPVEEISFANAVKDQEQKLLDREPRKDSIATVVEPLPAGPSPADSLVLEATTTDSVWIRITIDGSVTHEYTFPSDYTMHWKAGKTFLISMGNAAGMFFTLNGFPVGVLSSSKKPVKNVTLSWQTVLKLQQQAGQ